MSTLRTPQVQKRHIHRSGVLGSLWRFTKLAGGSQNPAPDLSFTHETSGSHGFGQRTLQLRATHPLSEDWPPPPYYRHRLDGYLAKWVPSPPGKHTFQSCMCNKTYMLPKNFRQGIRLGPHWSKYPFSRCRLLPSTGSLRENLPRGLRGASAKPSADFSRQ